MNSAAIFGGNLSSLMEHMAKERQEDERRPKITKAGQIAELTYLAGEYASAMKTFPFKVGDWITPRKNVGINNAGEPHIIVAIREDADYEFITNKRPGTSGQGQYNDMRLLCYVGEDVVPFWAESWMYEPYDISKA
jgi:hypothetical protein